MERERINGKTNPTPFKVSNKRMQINHVSSIQSTFFIINWKISKLQCALSTKVTL
jgi:hypothetical protein